MHLVIIRAVAFACHDMSVVRGEVVTAVATRLLGRPARVCSRLTGGQHAATTVVTDGVEDYVLRQFPRGDQAVSQEITVLDRVASLGAMVPQLIAYDADPAGPSILTTRVPGGPPTPDLPLEVIALEMARALAQIHQLDASTLRIAPKGPPAGASPIAALARQDWPTLDRSTPVFTHSDFWCGNALWESGRLTGVVDWSGAGQSPRGEDVAWCRLDLVLLGSPSAADVFLAAYRNRCGREVVDIAAWDQQAAAYADDIVESWAPNYVGIGRPGLTADVLRRRFDRWAAYLLRSV